MKMSDVTIADTETAAQLRWRQALERVGGARGEMTEPVATDFKGTLHILPRLSAAEWKARRVRAHQRRLERDKANGR